MPSKMLVYQHRVTAAYAGTNCIYSHELVDPEFQFPFLANQREKTLQDKCLKILAKTSPVNKQYKGLSNYSYHEGYTIEEDYVVFVYRKFRPDLQVHGHVPSRSETRLSLPVPPGCKDKYALYLITIHVLINANPSCYIWDRCSSVFERTFRELTAYVTRSNGAFKLKTRRSLSCNLSSIYIANKSSQASLMHIFSHPCPNNSQMTIMNSNVQIRPCGNRRCSCRELIMFREIQQRLLYRPVKLWNMFIGLERIYDYMINKR